MKKIILSITSIIIGAIIAITLVLVFYDKKREVYVKSSYNDVRLSLGKTKVKKTNKIHSSPIEVEHTYYISDPFEFYEEQIKTSEYYNSKLVFTDKYDNIYGYLVKDEVAFKFEVTDETLTLSTMGVEGFVYDDYSLLLCDINSFASSSSDIAMYGMDYFDWTLFYNQKMLEFEDIVELYKHMNGDMVKIEDDVIYLKGYDFYNFKMSDDYIVKIVNIDGFGYGYACNYQEN